MNSFILEVSQGQAEFRGFEGNELVMITSDSGKVTFNTRPFADNNYNKHKVVITDGVCTDKSIIDLLINCHYDAKPTEFREMAGTYLPF